MKTSRKSCKVTSTSKKKKHLKFPEQESAGCPKEEKKGKTEGAAEAMVVEDHSVGEVVEIVVAEAAAVAVVTEAEIVQLAVTKPTEDQAIHQVFQADNREARQDENEDDNTNSWPQV